MNTHEFSNVDVRDPHAFGFTVIELMADDLPCPWCGQATHETDATCKGCGRRFG